MMTADFDLIAQQLLTFTKTKVTQFLVDHPNKVFYAFAYDCNAEYAEVNLCFNTEADFKSTLHKYLSGEFAENYKNEASVNDLKLNTGDWEYQCFASQNFFSDDELNAIFNMLPEDDYVSWNNFVDDLNNLFAKTLVEFSKASEFAVIPKTKDFKFFSTDHDEDFAEAQQRMAKYLA